MRQLESQEIAKISGGLFVEVGVYPPYYYYPTVELVEYYPDYYDSYYYDSYYNDLYFVDTYYYDPAPYYYEVVYY